MPLTQNPRDAIEAFANRYDYDMSYQTQLLNSAPDAFEVFARAQGVSSHRRALSKQAHYVARIAMMQAEDCGGCLVLNLRMALEAGVDRALLVTLLDHPEDLEASLRDIRDHAFEVSRQPTPDPERVRRLREDLGEEAFAELAICLAGCRLFTTVKRALAKAHPKQVIEGDF